MTSQKYSLKQLAQGHRPIRIGFFLVPDFPLMTFSAALDSLRQGNRLAGGKVFEWTLLSTNGGHIKSSSGLGFDMDGAITKAPRCDVVILCAGSISPTGTTRRYSPGCGASIRKVACSGQSAPAYSFWPRPDFSTGAAVRCTGIAGELPSRVPQLSGNRRYLRHRRALPDLFGGDRHAGHDAVSDRGVEGRELATQISDQFNHPRIRQQDDAQRMEPENRFGIRNSKLGLVVRRMEASLSEPVDISELAESVASPSASWNDCSMAISDRARRNFTSGCACRVPANCWCEPT